MNDLSELVHAHNIAMGRTTNQMTDLPEPVGRVVGEERGYCDWLHIIDWKHNYNMPKGTAFYTEDQMREYRNQALEDAAKLFEPAVTPADAARAAAIRALKGELK